VSKRVQYLSEDTVNYFMTTAISDGVDLRGTTAGHVGNHEGTLEFWVKLSEGGIGQETTTGVVAKGLAYGLIGITTRGNARTGTTSISEKIEANPYYEGTQTYVYINTLGKLRVSRLYYAMYWDSSAGPLGTNGLPIGKWRGALHPETQGDINRRYPRRDAVVDLAAPPLPLPSTPWQAHEWHHIRASWNDTDSPGGSHLKVWIDGTQVPSGCIETCTGSLSGGEFCVLNQKDPYDIFFVNGFFRDQKERGGYFHFGLGTSSNVHYPGNATLDRLASYRTKECGTSSPQRFPLLVDTASSPEHPITIPIPYSGRFILGRLRWTAYPHIDESLSVAIPPAYVLCKGAPAATPNFIAPYVDTTRIGHGGEGLMPSGHLEVSGSVSYHVEFHNTASRCATLDSVSVTLFYVTPRLATVQWK
jgi:hypothetical protein